MSSRKGRLRDWLRGHSWWLAFQEARREGLLNAAVRVRFQNMILGTPPVRTRRDGPVEVRALTWRRDWKNMVWALKSFYHFAGVDYPLHLHDGGLSPQQVPKLLAHFPDAIFVGREEADRRVAEMLRERELTRCLEYRLKNPSTRKLFDFFMFSDAEYIISIDSDIVFFDRPDLLLVPPEGVDKNRYNRDSAPWYSMTPEELERAFGIRPPERINSGLSIIRNATVDFEAI